MADEKSVMEFRPASVSIGGKGSADHQFKGALRGIAIDGDDRIYAVGDSSVKIFNNEGKLLRRWKTALPGFCVAVGGDGTVWVGEYRQVEIFDPQGALVDTWSDPDRLGLLTAIALRDEDVFIADASARWIRRFDRQGRFLNNIGDKHRKGGFHIPNGVVDFAIDDEGILHVANPGMHRVERYKADGELLGHFGRFDGRDPAGFPGCCNPTNLALDRKGRVIVSEKAGPRAKIYSPEGQLLTVVSDEGFDPNAKNMDVAVDSAGRIYVVDTIKLEIRVFSPTAEEATG
jgi:sugar lactone lactonase YvrE